MRYLLAQKLSPSGSSNVRLCMMIIMHDMMHDVKLTKHGLDIFSSDHLTSKLDDITKVNILRNKRMNLPLEF